MKAIKKSLSKLSLIESREGEEGKGKQKISLSLPDFVTEIVKQERKERRGKKRKRQMAKSSGDCYGKVSQYLFFSPRSAQYSSCFPSLFSAATYYTLSPRSEVEGSTPTQMGHPK